MTTLKEALKGKLSKKEYEIAPSSFDVVGNIAIFSDFPDELKKKEKLIAETLMKLNSNIKTVARKTKFYSGRYRTMKVKIIVGEKNTETIHKENGIAMKLDVEKCYFSPRLSAERLRVAKSVKKNENVLVMFSGVGAYALVISRNSKAKTIYGVELNPAAHKYAAENAKINKFKNVIFVKGDASKIVPKLKIKFDRIIMPLPKTAEKYLGAALGAAKKNTVIHFYDFQPEDSFENSIKMIKRHVKKIKVLNIVKCGQYSPKIYRICVDFKII